MPLCHCPGGVDTVHPGLEFAFFGGCFALQSIHEFLRERFLPPKKSHLQNLGIQIHPFYIILPQKVGDDPDFPELFAFREFPSPSSEICSKKKDKATGPQRRVQQNNMSTLRISELSFQFLGGSLFFTWKKAWAFWSQNQLLWGTIIHRDIQYDIISYIFSYMCHLPAMLGLKNTLCVVLLALLRMGAAGFLWKPESQVIPNVLVDVGPSTPPPNGWVEVSMGNSKSTICIGSMGRTVYLPIHLP